MPNWCSNEIQIEGSESHLKAVKELIINDYGLVDFGLVRPAPTTLQPFIVNDDKEYFELNKSQPNRLGLLSIDRFKEAVSELHLKTGNSAFGINNIYTLTCRHLDTSQGPDETVESLIESYVRKQAGNPHARNTFGGDELGRLMSAMFDAMATEYSLFHGKSDVMLNADYHTWCRQNWGTMWNAQNERIQANDELTTYLFSTAWKPPLYWFEELSEMICSLNLQVRMLFTYAEFDTNISGFLIRDPDGSVVEKPMSMSGVLAFLGMEEDEIDD